jgi:hypothetical protein
LAIQAAKNTINILSWGGQCFCLSQSKPALSNLCFFGLLMESKESQILKIIRKSRSILLFSVNHDFSKLTYRK